MVVAGTGGVVVCVRGCKTMTPSLAAIADTLEARSKAAKLLDRTEMLDLAKTLREINERFGGNVLRFRKRDEGRVVMIHKLVDDAVVREPEGIAARCECGWKSGHHFTAMAASAAFLAHQEFVAESERRTCPTS
jgi:hypothetical protein